MILSFNPKSWSVLCGIALLMLSGVFVFYERPAETAPPPVIALPEVSTPPLALVGVRDIAPPGAPAQVAPLPPLRRTYTTDCGATAQSAAALSPHNLLRWAFEPDLGFPNQGYDLYRCCDVEVAPPPGDPDWVKLNKDRIRPPQTNAEGQVFVAGVGLLPDLTRNVIGQRITPTEWVTYCNALSQATGLPSDCPPAPPQTPPDPTAQTFEVSQDPSSFLLLASLKPEIATLLGLYWVDDKFESPSCIYRVVGHWDGGIQHESVTGPLTETPLSPPNGLNVSQSPEPGGFSCDTLGGPTQAAGNPQLAMNLTWDVPSVQSMSAAPDTSIMFNVCRQAPGDGSLVQITRATYDDGSGPVLVESPMVVPRVPGYDGQGNMLLTPSGDPLMVLPEVFYSDLLANDPPAVGTYNYAITGLDIFGRESLPSPPFQLPLIDPIGPPSPVNVQAETLQPPTSLTADVNLSFDWTTMEAEAAPDTTSFKVFRRVDTPDLTMNGQCPVMPQDDPANWELVATVPIGAYAQLYNAYNPLPVDEQAALGQVLPVQRYTLTDTLALPPGPPVRHYFYRVVAFDAPSGNPGPPSGSVNGYVVDTAPAVPPTDVTPIYSYSEWDSSVQVHLMWSAGATTGADPMGYKVMRSLRALQCTTSSQCPKDCDQNGCTQTPCHPSGFCGDGPDLGPTGHRQEDREAMLTNGVETYNSDTQLKVIGKLRSLATLGNLFYRDPATGARVEVAPACMSGNAAACSQELEFAIDGRTQYHQDTIPADASGQVFFYRVIAVSQAGLQESDDSVASSVSPPFAIQAPDFIAPSRPEFVGVIADGVSGGALSVQWAVSPESDTIQAGAGYTLERADVSWQRCEEQRAVCCELPSGGSSAFHWLERGACASQGGQRLDEPKTVQVYKEITSAGLVLTIADPAQAAPTSEVIITNELGGYCTSEVPVCCELPASPYPDYLLSDAAMCTTMGGSPWNAQIIGNSGSHTLDNLSADRCYRVDVVAADPSPDTKRVLKSAYVLGGAPATLRWQPPGDLNTVALIVRHDLLAPLNTSAPIVPSATPQTVDGYDVVTLNPGAPDERLSFIDTPPIDGHDYCYALRVKDAAGNVSPYSVPLVGRSVDMTPPAPPGGLSVARESGIATLTWTHDESPVRVRIKRSMAGPNGPWLTLEKAAKAIEVADQSIVALDPENFEHWVDGSGYAYRYRDMSAELARDYWYRVQVYDATGQKSGRDDGKVLLGAND